MDVQHSSSPAPDSITVPQVVGTAATRHDQSASSNAWWRTRWATRVALLVIVLLGASFRTLGLTTWDAGTGQHPDERFFTDVASLVRVPTSLPAYFDSARSPANPRNVGKTFFVYGSFPIALTRVVAVTLTPNAALPETVADHTVPMNPQTGFRPTIPNPELRVPKLTLLHPLLNPEGRNLTTYHEIVKVGRSLAVLFDLGSIVLVFLIGRRLFGRRVGLLAALLAALAVMSIQQAHFFVDPIFSTFFALLALYWAVRVAAGGGMGSYAALGISIGAAMANRITLATLGLIAIVAAVLAAWTFVQQLRAGACPGEARGRDEATMRPRHTHPRRVAASPHSSAGGGAGAGSVLNRFVSRDLPLLCLAGALTLCTFRVLQPDAFIGSWPDSPPLATPAGTPPAPTFLRGWGVLDVRPDPRFLANMQEVQKFVTGEIDFYPSQQWVRRPAYLFPWQNMVRWGMGIPLGLTVWVGWAAFGVLTIGHALTRSSGHALTRSSGHAGEQARRDEATARGHIASSPHVHRSNASLTLWVWIAFYFGWQGQQFASTMRYMLPIYGALIIFGAWLLIWVWDWGQREGARTRRGDDATTPPPSAYQRLVASLLRWLPILVVLSTLAWAYAFTRIYTRPHSRVIAARWLLDRAPPGSVITAESWDDALPLAVDGGDPWRTTYRGLTMATYGEEDPAKYFGAYTATNEFQPGLLDQLDQADYITLTSNRVYGSTVRLPMRYPGTLRYYDALFSGDLGFDLVADITSYPRLFGIPIPDQHAEEAFTVYDHPRVLIFRKNPDRYSRARAEELITAELNWAEVYKLPVRIADRTATALRLTESRWPTYRAAGTWRDLFSTGRLMRTLAPLVWLLTLQIIGLATFALLFHLVPWLPDRGLALARALGLLLVAYAAWLLGSLNVMAFTPQSVWLCALPLLAGGAAVAWRSRRALRAFWQQRRAAILTAEALYLGVFLLFLAIRWLNPELWHPARGGEKPMDLAYLTAVLKSAAFPPYDPWFAGGSINYYYFGFVIVGTLTHLTTIAPAVAYNLAVPTLAALVAVGAWGVVYNLLAPRKRSSGTRGGRCDGARTRRGVAMRMDDARRRRGDEATPSRERRARVAALLAPLFVVLMGNLAQAIWFLDGYAARQHGRPEWAFWDATRIVEGTINEFPFFTFLFADLHAHMIVMPFSLAMLGLTVALTRIPRTVPLHRSRSFIGILLLLGLLAGTVRATNTWDYPTYGGVTVVTLGLVFWQRFQRSVASSPHVVRVSASLLGFLLSAATVVLVGNLLFWPFLHHFVTESSGAELWREGMRATWLEQVWFAPRTSLSDLLRLYGHWLFVLISAGVLLAARRWRLNAGHVGVIVVGLLALVVSGVALRWAALLLLFPLLLGAAGLAWRMRRAPPRMLLPLLWAGTALALTAMVELVVVRGDIGRMNTVFKFGLHAWTLFALAAAVAMPWMLERLSVHARERASAGAGERSSAPEAVERSSGEAVTRSNGGAGEQASGGAGEQASGEAVTRSNGGAGERASGGAGERSSAPEAGERASGGAGERSSAPEAVERSSGDAVTRSSGGAGELLSAKRKAESEKQVARSRFARILFPPKHVTSQHPPVLRVALSAFCVWLWRGTALLLLLAGLVYPLTATPARIGDRYAEDGPRTLDGAAFLQHGAYSHNNRRFPLRDDAEGIAWLHQNVTGTPIILEAHLPAYQWGARIATYTGLPTLLGWEWHQIQQRNAVQAVGVIHHRKDVVARIYGGADADEAWRLIQQYGIEYIYVGGLERAMYETGSLARFETLVAGGRLERVFTSGETTIYRVRQPGTPTMLTFDRPIVPPQLNTLPPLMLDQPVNELPPVGGYAWNRWANAHSWRATLVWLGAWYVLLLLGLPLAVLVFGDGRDAGVAWARLIGLLILGYAVWLPTSAGLWPYDGWGIAGGIGLVLAFNVGVLLWLGRKTEARRRGWARRRCIVASSHRRGVLGGAIALSEVVFLAGFGLFVVIRAFNPDLWHPVWGGEKPMEFGFLNAILRSPVMPPLDPFFSGGYINYYYYGLYLMSLPIKLTGIHPAMAFNLSIATLFGLTLAGSYTLVTRLTGRRRDGLVGAAFVALLGNLASVIPIGWARGMGPVLAVLWRDGLAGLTQLGDWYVGPSRVINPPNTINEFPFWGFLFADLHPHLIALPITLLLIALAFELLLLITRSRGDATTRRGDEATPRRGGDRTTRLRAAALLTALTLGTLAVTNAWDFPTSSLLVGMVLLGAAWRSTRQGIPWQRLVRAVGLTLGLTLGGMTLYLPFFDSFSAPVSGIGIVRDGTAAHQYLVIYGLFLAVLLPVFFGASWRVLTRRRCDGARTRRGDAASPPPAGADAPRVLLPLLICGMIIVTVWQPVPGLRLWLAVLGLIGVVLLLQRQIHPATWFTLALATLGWAVSLGIEVLYIGDHLAGGDAYRMNTVFKFGWQIWTLLALAAAASLPRFLRGLRRFGGETAQTVGLALLGGLVLLAAVFPLVGTPVRIANRFAVDIGPTLDGLAFLEQARFSYDCQAFGGCEPGVPRVEIDLQPDAGAIAWLNAQITGTPVIVQSDRWFYRGYGIRVAANTGFPTVVSGLHVDEQRDPEITRIRLNAVDTLFRTTDRERTLRLLARYGVDYVYVGSIERALYNAAGLQKFAAMDGTYLDTVYDRPGVRIYQVRDLPDHYAHPEPFPFVAEEPPPRANEGADDPPVEEPPADAPPVDEPPPTVDHPRAAELEALEAQVAADPTRATLAFGLAEQYRAQNRLDDAARVLAVAAAANPTDTGLHHLWGDILNQAGRATEAEQAYLLAAQANPTAGNWNKLGVALLEWGDLEKAELALTQALAIDPTASEPYYRLGQLYARQGDAAQARTALEQYLRLDPNGIYADEVRTLVQRLAP